MPVSDAQRASNKRYDDAHMRIRAAKMPISEAEALDAYARTHGLSCSGFIRAAVADAIARGFVPDKAQGKR